MSPVTQTLPEVLRKAVPGSTVVNLGMNVQIQGTWCDRHQEEEIYFLTNSKDVPLPWMSK